MRDVSPNIVVRSRAVHIHIEGKVQGVGFRPFVYRLAHQYGLKGWVNNGKDGVHIEVTGDPEQIQQFCCALNNEHPDLATITNIRLRPLGEKISFDDFQVVESTEHGTPNVLILPDLDTCDDCVAELNAPHNRRFQYAFITCTNCGPRYSIIRRLPYDRANTTMVDFPMCDLCLQEYLSPADRRFYSQTNSCHNCGIHLSLVDRSQKVLATEQDAIRSTVRFLRQGGLVAAKGLGGYLLLADAFNDTAVRTLRARKHRPTKPFALLYPNLSAVRKDVLLSAREQELLQSRQKPIVILNKKPGPCRIAPAVAPNQDTLGIMLPYTPLHYLLMAHMQQPLVATSGNISGSPILAAEEEVFQLLGEVADAFLVHDRDIAVPQDDSVLRLTPDSQTTVFLRRSRSYAPLFPHGVLQLKKNTRILALGAQQKSTITLTHEKNIYVSQYLGDLSNFETERGFHRTLDHFKQVLSFSPEFIVVDAHPQYSATLAGEKLADQWNLPLLKVQHHEAHFWAVLAENNLLEMREPVLGVIWDGTGWGDDETVWGGEFFLYQGGTFRRVAHLEYFPLLLGDKSALEPRLPALALCHTVPEAEELLKRKFSATEWRIYHQYLRREKYLRTSSMGRFFDAVASLLGLADKISFEGEAAMRLETLARQSLQKEGGTAAAPLHNYQLPLDAGNGAVSVMPAMIEILQDLKRNRDKSEIALHFHQALVQLIQEVVTQTRVRHVAFSGGVFQNAVLLDLLQRHLAAKAKLHFHRHLSPNDENISFGQMVCCAYRNGALKT